MATKNGAAPAAPEESKAVATQASGAVAAYDYGEDAGAGFENTSREDFSIPFLNLLQSNSPEVEQIDGAKASMLHNSVTNMIYPGQVDGIVVVPATTDHVYVEWRPREAGGGIVAIHALDSDAVKEARNAVTVGKFRNGAGNDMVETFYVYAIALFPDGPMPVVMSFSSTKIKKYKMWLTNAQTCLVDIGGGRRVNPPLFAHKYRVRSVKEKNTKGEFWNYDINPSEGALATSRLAPDDALYQGAKDLRDAYAKGLVKADTKSAKGDAGDGAAEGAGQGGGSNEKDAPF